MPQMAQTMWYILNTCFSTGALEFGNVLARGCSRDKDLKPKSPVVSQAVTACLWPHLAGGALCVTPLAGAGGETSLRKPAPDPSHSSFLATRLCPYHTAVINLGREYKCIQLLSPHSRERYGQHTIVSPEPCIVFDIS